MIRYCLTLDLKNDPELIRRYEEHHKSVWPEIKNSIRNAGILQMEIYRYATRLFMIIEVKDDFSFDDKKKADDANPKVQEWEHLMWQFQQSVGTGKNEKWVLMNRIFEL